MTKTIHQQSVEIMSPVGSYESLMAAIQGGADSIYFGVGKLNMRARSANPFTLEDLSKITGICREHAVRSYLTLNTIVYDNELDEMHAILEAAKKHGVTAVIAADLSVMSYARRIGLEVHISTQCNITNVEAVRFFAQYADVMVLARELNLSQVAHVVKAIEAQNITGPSGELVQIEMFAHGALCMAVSGKCYLSLDNYQASANRGACLQLCRRPYQVKDLDGGTELMIDNAYIMSPKDLKTIDFLDKIIASGVKVLKIEGRGRSSDYVKTVTAVYKEAVMACGTDAYNQEQIDQWNARLSTVYNRGFWSGYYLGKTMGEWADRYGSKATKQKVYVGKVTNYFQKIQVAEILLEAGELQVGDDILVTGETTGVYEDVLREIRVDLQPVEHANKGVLCSIPTSSLLRRGDKLYKLTDREA